MTVLDYQNMNEQELDANLDLLVKSFFEDDSHEDLSKGLPIEIAKDSSKTADEAVANVPVAQDDAKRGAGRPSEISGVPSKDQDGKRAGSYDGDIKENEDKEDEPYEAKKQSPVIDQTTDKGHGKENRNAAPDQAPFKKSFGDDPEYIEFLAWKQNKESLAKSFSAQETKFEDLTKSLETIQGRIEQVEALNKSLLAKPERPKAVVGVEQLEKSSDPSGSTQQREEPLNKAQVNDVLESLVKSQKIPEMAAIEYDTTGTVYNQQHRTIIESALSV